MIICIDGNRFEKLAEVGIGSEVDVIFERHFVDDSTDDFIHPIKSLAGKKVLGWGEISSPLHTAVSSVKNEHIRAVEIAGREHLKRAFFSLCNRDVENITVAKLKLIDVEKYWCSHCESWDLILLPKNIISEKIPFLCADCKEECYLESREEPGYYHVKIKGAMEGLEGRYKRRESQRADRKKLLSGQEIVMVF